MNNQEKKINLFLEVNLLLLLSIIWGSTFIFLKIASETIPFITLSAARVTIGFFFLASIFVWKQEKVPKDRLIWRMLFIQSFFSVLGSWTMQTWGVQHINSGIATILSSTSPIFVFFISLFLSNGSINFAKLASTLLGMIGIFVIVGVDTLSEVTFQSIGIVASLFGSLLIASGVIYGRKYLHVSPMITCIGILGWASVCLIPLSLALEQPWTLTITTEALLAVVMLGILCTGCTLLIYFRLIRTLGALGASSQGYLRIGVGVYLGSIVFGEQITPSIIAGTLLIIIGVVGINLLGRSN